METKAAPSPVPRAVVFYHALAIRDMETLAPYLDDQVVWTISGPVDILPFCGQRVGKDVVMKLLVRDIPTFLSGRRFIPQHMLVDGDRAAVLGKLIATKRETASSATALPTSSDFGMKRLSNTCRSSTVLMPPSRCSAILLGCATGSGWKATSSPFKPACGGQAACARPRPAHLP